MAKKSKDAAYEEFLADLRAVNPQIEEILKDEKVSAKLRDGVLARADYSANMDALRAEREQFASEVAEARQNIQGWQKWYGDATAEVATVQTKLQKYEQMFGPIESAADTRQAARQLGVSKEELNSALEERMNQRDLAALKFADDLTDIKLDFQSRFKDRLDTTAVFELAGKRGVDLRTAYDLHIADRVEELRSKDIEARIKQAREEAVSEYASKHNLPVAPTTSDMTHTLDVKDAPKGSHDRVAAAVAAFRQGAQR